MIDQGWGWKELLATGAPIIAGVVVVMVGVIWLAYETLKTLRDHLHNDFWERHDDRDDEIS